MSRFLPYLTTQALRPFAGFFPDMLWRVPPPDNRPVLYLTFDDGPTPSMTEELLALLDRHDAKATWFLIGVHASNHSDLTTQLVEAGHTIGNHTYTHPDAWRTPTDRLRSELYRTTALLDLFTEQPTRHMRPPYGHFTRSMRTWCKTNGQQMVMWDVMPGDYLPTATPSKLIRHVQKSIRPGSVIVLHDNPICRDVTLPALRILLPQLKAQGWTFEAL